MSDNENNSWGGLMVGPMIVVVAVLALWHNEGRFDYYKAARKTEPVLTVAETGTAETVSFTGALEPCVISGRYVEKFAGFYEVSGEAEIYSWERDRDSDGHITWSKGWNYSVESDERNSGITQSLSNVHLRADDYRVGELVVSPDGLSFPDRPVSIGPEGLELTETGRKLGLTADHDGFYLRRGGGKGDQLGDERITFTGTPAEATATYFGRAEESLAAGKQFEDAKGFIKSLIEDEGRLHHLANGDRQTALRTVKSYLSRLKWKIRLFGTVGIMVGIGCFFSKILYLVVSLPVVGALVNAGLFVFSVVMGGLLSLLTILASQIAHGLSGVLVPLGIVGAVVLIITIQRRETKRGAGTLLANGAGGVPAGPEEPREAVLLSFRNLARVAMADGHLHARENDYLVHWGQARGLVDEEMQELFAQIGMDRKPVFEPTSRQDFSGLVSLALVDGTVTPSEIRQLVSFGATLGIGRREIGRMIKGIRKAHPGALPNPVPAI